MPWVFRGNPLQASLPVVDNNRKVVGALAVVGEKLSKHLAKISEMFEQKIKLKVCSIFSKMLYFGKIPTMFGEDLAKIQQNSEKNYKKL